MITQILAILWIILIIVPAFFWYFLVKEFNKKAKTRFPAFLYSILYLIPIAHYFISWSIIKDIRGVQIKAQHKKPLLVSKTFFLNLALPHFFLVAGLYVFTILGVLMFLTPFPFLGTVLVDIATFVPFISFIWLVWGFKSLKKTIQLI